MDSRFWAMAGAVFVGTLAALVVVGVGGRIWFAPEIEKAQSTLASAEETAGGIERILGRIR